MRSCLQRPKRYEDSHHEERTALSRLAEAQRNKTNVSRDWPIHDTAKRASGTLGGARLGCGEWLLASTMAEVLNRMGFRLRKVVKAKPQKKIAETDAIFC